MLEVRLTAVRVDLQSNTPVVLLQEATGERSLPIFIGAPEATAIAYAPCDLEFMPDLDWPEWCRDQQKPGTRLRAGDPVCTVFAEAEEPGAARAIVGDRLGILRDDLLAFGNEESAA